MIGRYVIPAAILYLLFGRSKRWTVENRDNLVYIVRYNDSFAEFFPEPGVFDETDYLNTWEKMDIIPGNEIWEFQIYPTGSNKGIYFNARTGAIERKIRR